MQERIRSVSSDKILSTLQERAENAEERIAPNGPGLFMQLRSSFPDSYSLFACNSGKATRFAVRTSRDLQVRSFKDLHRILVSADDPMAVLQDLSFLMPPNFPRKQYEYSKNLQCIASPHLHIYMTREQVGDGKCRLHVLYGILYSVDPVSTYLGAKLTSSGSDAVVRIRAIYN